MPITLNGTTGIVTPAENTSALTVGSITGILKATSGVVSQAVAGTDYLTSSSGSAITLATAQTASGTSVDFTGIPSWAKRITVMFNGLSLNTADDILVQIGGSGGIETSAYSSGSTNIVYSTSGFIIRQGPAARILSVVMFIININANSWVSNHSGNVDTLNDVYGGGNKTLTSTLDRIRITSVTGTSLFDAGTINISYE